MDLDQDALKHFQRGRVIGTDPPPLIADRHPCSAAALPRDSLTVAKSRSSATKNSTVDKMANQ